MMTTAAVLLHCVGLEPPGASQWQQLSELRLLTLPRSGHIQGSPVGRSN